MWIHKMPRPSSEPWGQTTPTLRTHPHKSRDGSSTSRIEIQEDHPREEKEGRHPAHQGRRLAEVVEVAEVAEAEEAEEAEEHSLYPDKPLPNRLKNF